MRTCDYNNVALESPVKFTRKTHVHPIPLEEATPTCLFNYGVNRRTSARFLPCNFDAFADLCSFAANNILLLDP